MDTVDKATRSRYMAAVRSRGNLSTERKMLQILRKYGLKGWRRHYRIEGTPDFCWPKYKIALFVDGCFWHGCPRCYKTPKSNVRFWKTKVLVNRERDIRITKALRRKGWTVVRIWECLIKKKKTIARIRRALLSVEATMSHFL